MKKLLLITLSAGLSFGAFAQSVVPATHLAIAAPTKQASSRSVNRTTSTSFYNDSLVLSNLSATDTITAYYAGSSSLFDSGYFYGTNAYGFNEFAERYDFTAADSTIQVLGVAAVLVGRVHTPSTKSIVFKAWDVSAPVPIRSTLSYSGFPNNVLDSISVSVDSLGINDTAYTEDFRFFHTPTAYLSSSFFVGLSINYTWSAEAGDTIGIATSTDGERTAPFYTVSGGDTSINDQSVLNYPSGGGMYDVGEDIGNSLNYFIFPIINSHVTSGFKGITKNNFTFYGNYPNPAVDNTNIKFSLASTDDVTITISDMAGRTINTIVENNLEAGMHIVNIATANLAAGDYVYLVRTASGNGMASKLTIAK